MTRKPTYEDLEKRIRVLEEGSTGKGKQAEEALRENEGQLRQIIDEAPISMAIVDMDGTIEYINRKTIETFGYAPDDIPNMDRWWAQAYPDEDYRREVIATWMGLVEKALTSGAAIKGQEYRVTCKDGTLRTNSIFGVPVANKVFVLFDDITERKQAENALHESEERFRSMVQSLSDMIFILDRNGQLTYESPSVSRMLGYQPGYFMGKSPFTHIHPDDLDQVVKDMDEVFRFVNAGIPTEFRHRKADGTWAYLEALGSNELESPGIRGIILTVRDISERKRSEQALRDSESKYQFLAESMADVVFTLDLNLATSYVSPSIEGMLGFTQAERMAQKVEQQLTPASLKLVFETLVAELNRDKENNVDPNRSQTLELEYYHKDGSIKHLVTYIRAIRNSEGHLTGIYGSHHDITERKWAEEEHKKLEERLQRSEKMESLGTLAGGVAHDLNNVLGVLVGYSELLREKLPEGNMLRKYADNILQSSIRGAAIIQDLLTLARRGVTVSEVMDLNGVIRDYLKTPEFENLKDHHWQVRFLTELEEGLLNIKGSPVHLGKTLMNLISNASEAISGRGEVTIRTENRYLDQPIQGYDEVKEGDYVVLTVSDTGMGISADDLGKIFEPFYTKKVMGRSGTGLGLAVVWGTVKDHHGYIDLQSEEDKGSTFTLYFPVTRDEPASTEKTADLETYTGRGESLLVVDDVQEQRELAGSMLGSLGYQVESVASGEAAIEHLKSKKADLVVLDMIMDPGMDGMETYRSILEIHPKQKAIIVSGFSETDRVRKAQDMGAGAFVRKPYILEKIGLAVRKELDRR